MSSGMGGGGETHLKNQAKVLQPLYCCRRQGCGRALCRSVGGRSRARLSCPSSPGVSSSLPPKLQGHRRTTELCPSQGVG